MGNQALPDRLKTMTTKSEGLGLTEEGRSRERVCAQINTNTRTHADRTLQKEKESKTYFGTFWEGPQVKKL